MKSPQLASYLMMKNGNFSSKIKNKTRVSTLTTPTQHSSGGPSQRIQDRTRKAPKLEAIKLFLFADDMILYEENPRGAWVAQSVKRLTSAQVMISWLVGSQAHVRLCADSSEPGVCFGFCVSVCLCLSPAHALSVSLFQK